MVPPKPPDLCFPSYHYNSCPVFLMGVMGRGEPVLLYRSVSPESLGGNYPEIYFEVTSCRIELITHGRTLICVHMHVHTH